MATRGIPAARLAAFEQALEEMAANLTAVGDESRNHGPAADDGRRGLTGASADDGGEGLTGATVWSAWARAAVRV